MSRTGTQNARATELLSRATAAVTGEKIKSLTGLSGRTFQATLGPDGTAAATVDIEVSNDGIAWIPMGTITLSGANDTDGFVSNEAWVWVRADLTALGAGAAVTVTQGV